MNRTFLLSILFLIISCTNSERINQEIISHEDEPILVGKIDLIGLSNEPHKSWFEENYKPYTVDLASLCGIPMDDLEIDLFLGTWCEDSQLQVPQFYKILVQFGYDMNNLRMIALDNHPERDLQSPGGEHEGKNIEYVPTFIFYRDGEEIGRIVEYPEETLEKDMAKILLDSYQK